MVAWPLILGIISHTGLFRFYILLISIITLGKKVELHTVTLPCKAFRISKLYSLALSSQQNHTLREELEVEGKEEKEAGISLKIIIGILGIRI